ncbi:hypothetical protein N8D56_17350 [Devosia sp. A8/3-2]|nr:hypothetical protein N8D56_17350 [Devosia sp. A8/3-2]
MKKRLLSLRDHSCICRIDCASKRGIEREAAFGQERNCHYPKLKALGTVHGQEAYARLLLVVGLLVREPDKGETVFFQSAPDLLKLVIGPCQDANFLNSSAVLNLSIYPETEPSSSS